MTLYLILSNHTDTDWQYLQWLTHTTFHVGVIFSSFNLFSQAVICFSNKFSFSNKFKIIPFRFLLISLMNLQLNLVYFGINFRELPAYSFSYDCAPCVQLFEVVLLLETYHITISMVRAFVCICSQRISFPFCSWFTCHLSPFHQTLQCSYAFGNLANFISVLVRFRIHILSILKGFADLPLQGSLLCQIIICRRMNSVSQTSFLLVTYPLMYLDCCHML